MLTRAIGQGPIIVILFFSRVYKTNFQTFHWILSQRQTDKFICWFLLQNVKSSCYVLSMRKQSKDEKVPTSGNTNNQIYITVTIKKKLNCRHSPAPKYQNLVIWKKTKQKNISLFHFSFAVLIIFCPLWNHLREYIRTRRQSNSGFIICYHAVNGMSLLSTQ